MSRLNVVCWCGSGVYYYCYYIDAERYDYRCARCNAIVHPEETQRLDFLYHNEKAGYCGTD